MIDAPLRLYLKTKDHRRGQSAVFGFPIVAPKSRRARSADLRFQGVCGDRLSLVGVVRAFETERELGKGERCEAFSDCRSGSLVWRADDARGTAQGRGARGGLRPR